MKKILIVEDHEDIREVIRITLEMERYELHEAADGQQALRLAAQIRPDLVLSDVVMPGMDGLSLCKQIKGDPALKRTKVVLLSSRDRPEDRKTGTGAGADAYVVKPYSPLDLLSTVRRVVG